MFKNLPGFRDFYPEECALRNSVFQVWRDTASRFGFSEFDAPILEPLELLTTKSGAEIVSQLFNFEDKGGRAVTLRPELTPSLARMVGAKAGSLKRPIKWFSIGENFRYERPQKGRLRSFYQFNADILGEAGPAADAEVIALLIGSLTSFGLTDDEFCIRLSDRTLWLLFLESQEIVGELALSVLNILDKFERESEDKLSEKLSALGLADAGGLLAAMTELKGVSSLAEIQAFLAKAESSDELKERIEVRISQFQALLDNLAAMGVGEFIKLDLGIVRGLAYYTGFVFEAFQTVGKGRALAGGGRYDDLVKKLGGQDLPAVGFGMGDVTLIDLLEQREKKPENGFKLDAYGVASAGEAREALLSLVFQLRREGFAIDYSLKGGNWGKQFKAADQSGARFALVLGEDELSTKQVIVKNLSERTEEKVGWSELNDYLKNSSLS